MNRRGGARAARLAVLLWACLAAAPARAQSGDPAPPPRTASVLASDLGTPYQERQGWFSRDKAYHAAISAVGAAGLYAVGREIGLGRWASAAGATVVMGAVGVLREVWKGERADVLTRGHLSRQDLVWDGVGIVVGITVTDRLFAGRWRR